MIIGILVNIGLNVLAIIISLIVIWFVLKPKLFFTIQKKSKSINVSKPKKIPTPVNKDILKLAHDGNHDRIHIDDYGIYVFDLAFDENNNIIAKEKAVLTVPKILTKKEIKNIDILSSNTFWAEK